MTRETTAARVRDLAGPLGPFRSIEQQARDTDNWLDSMGSGAIDVLVDFFIAPAPNELQHVDPEEFADIVDELLCRVATIRPLDSVPLLATYLADDRTRSHVADALGAAGSKTRATLSPHTWPGNSVWDLRTSLDSGRPSPRSADLARRNCSNTFWRACLRRLTRNRSAIGSIT